MKSATAGSPRAKQLQRQIDRNLREIAQIQGFIHNLTSSDLRDRLFAVKSLREDAVRGLILQFAMAIESLLDDLITWAFLGWRPRMTTKTKRRFRGRRSQMLEELLGARGIGFERKLKMARLIGVISPRQYDQLEKLRDLRNKCAHNWMLDVVRKRAKRQRRSTRLLEYKDQNLFARGVIDSFASDYGRIYLRLFEKLYS